MLGTDRGKLFNQYVKDYVVFDLETTGISTAADEVIEISAVKVLDEKVVDEFTSLVNPQRPIPTAASNVNGITDAMVKDAPVFEKVLADFITFAGKLPLVGHNIHSFDMKFIYRDCEKYFGRTLTNDYVDTLKYARTYLPGRPAYKLVDLAAHYRISADGAHRALNDCRMNQQVFYHLGKEAKAMGEKKDAKCCPRCGMPLQLRNGKFGAFFGCMGFPDCRYTENVRSVNRSVRVGS